MAVPLFSVTVALPLVPPQVVGVELTEISSVADAVMVIESIVVQVCDASLTVT